MTGRENGPQPSAAITAADINVQLNHEPRVLDTFVGERLRMAQPLNIRAVIKANMAELRSYGEVFTRHVKPRHRGGRPSTEYWLNEGQALLICALSRAPCSPQVRRGLIKAFMELRHRERALPCSQATLKPQEPFLTREHLRDINRRAHDIATVEEERLREALIKAALEAVQQKREIDVDALGIAIHPQVQREARRLALKDVTARMEPVPNRRYLVWFDREGTPDYKPVPDDASVISPSGEVNLRTFLRDFVPMEMLPMALEIISARCAAELNRWLKPN